MRNLILLLLGVAVGAFGATNIVNTLRQRDAYPRGVMNVMQHHDATLREDVQLHHCDANTTSASLANMNLLASDLELVFYPDDTAETPFREYAQRLRDALAMTTAATDCPALATAVNKIGATCDACHRQYR